METDISLVLSIISIVLTIVNLIFLIIKYKQYRVHSEKILVKRRLFREWYKQVKDFTDRMEFTNVREDVGYTVYFYQVKNKDGSGYLRAGQVESLLERIEQISLDVLTICGYKIESKMIDLAEDIRNLFIRKSLSKDGFTVPNDMIPNDPEEFRTEMLNNVIINARENGIKKRYLI